MKGDAFFEVELKRVREGAKIPNFHSDMAAAVDLHACIDGPVSIPPRSPSVLVPTGISISIRRSHVVALLFPRSGLGHKQGLVMGNGTGVIDADYQGEIMVPCWNRNLEMDAKCIVINPGDRIAQMVLMPIFRPQFVEVTEFGDETARADGGWGSTGVAA